MSGSPLRVFLTGQWRYLAMLNYRVDPALLEPYVPRGTSLDQWEGTTYVSLVGFLFQNTRLLGVPVPLHRDFEEVNLRFYVRREAGGEVRRGVTFIREIVPRVAIASVARLAYNEPYVALPMRHTIGVQQHADGAPATIRYEWRQRGGWSALTVEAVEPPPHSCRDRRPSSSRSTTGATRGSATAGRSSITSRTRAGARGR